MIRIFATFGALLLAATISTASHADPAYPAQATDQEMATGVNPAAQLRWLQESQAYPGQQPVYPTPYPVQRRFPAPANWYNPYSSQSYVGGGN